jgi:hypothetical protein
MTRLFRGRPVLGSLALAIALFAVLGHVCVLPHEAHAVGAESADGHGSHDEHSQHDGLHAASCEAIPSTATAAASAAPVGASVMVVTAAAPAGGLIHASRRPATVTSPPLFLLHSALRI